jgi:hypothetical protein
MGNNFDYTKVNEIDLPKIIDERGYLPIIEAIHETILSIPTDISMSDEDLKTVIDVYNRHNG